MGLVDFSVVGKGEFVYFENVFASHTVLDVLADRGIGDCRTEPRDIH